MIFPPSPDPGPAPGLAYLEVAAETPDGIWIFPGQAPHTPETPVLFRNRAAAVLEEEVGQDPSSPIIEGILSLGRDLHGGAPSAERQIEWKDRAEGLRRTRIRARFTAGMILFRAVDSSLEWAVERGAARREALLGAVADAAAILLTGPWTETFDPYAARLGEAAGVSRVYLFQHRPDAPAPLVVCQTHEWCAPGVASELGNPALEDLDLEAVGAEHVAEMLSRGEPFAQVVEHSENPDLKALLEAQGVVSLLCLPVVVEGTWWGWIGFDDCAHPRTWTEGEVEALRGAARLLAIAIERDLHLKGRRASESRLAAAVTEGRDGFVVLTEEGRVVEANPAARHLLGWDDGKIPERIHDRLPGLAELLRSEGKTEPVRGGDLKGTREDGTDFEAEISLSPLALDGEHFVALSIRDITGREAAAQALLQAQRLDSMGRLAAGIAHDFNNLLTVIQGNAGLLRDTLAELGMETGELDAVQVAAARGAHLIRQLLVFSRHQIVRPAPLDLNETVRHVAGLLGTLFAPSIRLEIELDPALPPVHLDPGQAEQLLINLLLNARDATPEGGRVQVLSRRPLDAAPLPGRVLLTVADTGRGIAPAFRSQVFEPFFTTKPLGEGTGLGLSTVYGIVKQAGGDIALESELGRGTRVHIGLPSLPLETTGAKELADPQEAANMVEPRGRSSHMGVE